MPHKAKIDDPRYAWMWGQFPDKLSVWERCVEDHREVVKHNKYLSDTINDLTLSLGLWLDGYEMDAEDPEKLRQSLDRACLLIGKPRTMVELVEMSGLGDEYLELARQHDKETKQ